MNTCIQCKEEKPWDQFDKNRMMTSGRINKCKACVQVYNRQYKKVNRKKLTEVERRYRQERPKLHRKRLARYRAKPETRIKERCHHAVYMAVKRGDLVKQPCPCGATEVEGHHEDYSKPLDVIWLCRPCHKKLHAERTNGK